MEERRRTYAHQASADAGKTSPERMRAVAFGHARHSRAAPLLFAAISRLPRKGPADFTPAHVMARPVGSPAPNSLLRTPSAGHRRRRAARFIPRCHDSPSSFSRWSPPTFHFARRRFQVMRATPCGAARAWAILRPPMLAQIISALEIASDDDARRTYGRASFCFRRRRVIGRKPDDDKLRARRSA